MLVLRYREGLTQQVFACCCAISAGVHLALVPQHLGESLVLAAGFAAAALLLVALTTLLALMPADRRLALIGIFVMVGLIWLFALSRTVGLPGISEAEPLDVVGVFTQIVQVIGLLAALRLVFPKGESS